MPGKPIQRTSTVGRARTPDEGQGDLDATTLSAGEPLDSLVAVRAQVDQVQHLLDRARVGEVGRPQGQDLSRRQPVVEVTGLEHAAQPGPLRGSEAGRVHAQYLDPAGGPASEALQDLDGRRLAGAVGAREGEDLALTHLEVDAGHRLATAVAASQPSARMTAPAATPDGVGLVVTHGAATVPVRDGAAVVEVHDFEALLVVIAGRAAIKGASALPRSVSAGQAVTLTLDGSFGDPEVPAAGELASDRMVEENLALDAIGRDRPAGRGGAGADPGPGRGRPAARGA